jgi:hypothetical protein
VINYDTTYKKDGQILTRGYISLQSESHPIEFRKVEILDLDQESAGAMSSAAVVSSEKLSKRRK